MNTQIAPKHHFKNEYAFTMFLGMNLSEEQTNYVNR